MSQAKKPVTLGRVTVYDKVTQDEIPGPAKDLSDSRYSVSPVNAPAGLYADLRSPLDVFHPEAYLIGCLVKLYGWRVTEPGTLRRTWSAGELRAARAETAGSQQAQGRTEAA